MDIDEYMKETSKTAVYPEDTALAYLTLGLAGEAGEVANKVKKYYRGDLTINELRALLRGELGDTMWYMAQLCVELEIDLKRVLEENIFKLQGRLERGTIKGSGDNR